MMAAAPGRRCTRFATRSAYACGHWRSGISGPETAPRRARAARVGAVALALVGAGASGAGEPDAGVARAAGPGLAGRASRREQRHIERLRDPDRDAGLAAPGSAARPARHASAPRGSTGSGSSTRGRSPLRVIYNRGALNVSTDGGKHTEALDVGGP